MLNFILQEREYNTQRTCGVWLVYIGALIILSALAGGDLLIQPFLLGFGYFAGFVLILGLPFVNRKLAYGKNSKFQDSIDNFSVVLNVVLCTACGLIIGFEDLRLLWCSIFIAVGIHFFGFYFSQGKRMVLLGILTVLNGVLGLILISIPFIIFALIDGLLKLLIGVKMMSKRKEAAIQEPDKNTPGLDL
ncbi:DUF6609 family protein [Rossellomorea aquimaris]|uniref:Acid-resistance membrane protein n=1 Tax=Rossellomorea aquimaris TaxID=189382 RepID=A0A5D4TWB1_9BACI|nr:DUF6609 family protein [Rossellomorea aquimaris]TYS79675.1 hypothetical protein FZC80_08485 [Rossellomorea aquimaris]